MPLFTFIFLTGGPMVVLLGVIVCRTVPTRWWRR